MRPEQPSFAQPPLSPGAIALLRRDHAAGEHLNPHPDCQLCPSRVKGKTPKGGKQLAPR